MAGRGMSERSPCAWAWADLFDAMFGTPPDAELVSRRAACKLSHAFDVTDIEFVTSFP